jgi:hypothetical protein
MKNTWKAVLGVVLIFILGWLAGALCSWAFIHHRVIDLIHRGPEAVAEVLERRMGHNLNLDPAQKAQVHGFVLENLQQRRQLQKQIQPQIRTANQQMIKEIDGVLRPDQVQTLHENISEFKKRFGRNPFNAEADAVTTPSPPQ